MDKLLSFIKSKRIILVIVVSVLFGFFLGMEYKAYQIRSALSNVFGESTDTQQQTVQKQNIIEKKIGDDVAFATLNLKVNTAVEQQTLTAKYSSPIIADAGTKFVIINVDITNTINQPFDFIDDLNLIDGKDRQFIPYAHSIGHIDNYISMRTMSPGIKENGNFVYQLPDDATDYSLLIGKGGTDEYYKISLSTE